MAWELGDYATLPEVKRTLKPSGGMSTSDDDFLYDCIHDASDIITDYCRRWFYEVETTHYFHSEDDVDHDTSELILNDLDLLSVTSITVDNGGTALTSSEYVLYPRHSSPKSVIRLKENSSNTWSYSSTPEDSIAVTGKWGFNEGTVPIRPIRRACVHIVEWLYLERLNPMTGTVVMPNQGGLVIPVDLPKKATDILNRYRRPIIAELDL